jgi:hypothetical protein
MSSSSGSRLNRSSTDIGIFSLGFGTEALGGAAFRFWLGLSGLLGLLELLDLLDSLELLVESLPNSDLDDTVTLLWALVTIFPLGHRVGELNGDGVSRGHSLFRLDRSRQFLRMRLWLWRGFLGKTPISSYSASPTVDFRDFYSARVFSVSE